MAIIERVASRQGFHCICLLAIASNDIQLHDCTPGVFLAIKLYIAIGQFGCCFRHHL